MAVIEKKLRLQIEEARRVGAAELASEPKLVDGKYDEHSRKFILFFENHPSYEFDPELYQGLQGASSYNLKDFEISKVNTIRWEALDADFSSQEIMDKIYGTKNWIEQLREKHLID